MIAQIKHDGKNFAFSPDPGPVWHSTWRRGQVERNRRIYDCELVYVPSGRCRVVFESAFFDCGPGSAIVIPPGVFHYSLAVDAVERWCVHFDWFGDCRAHREAPRIFVFADGDVPFELAWMARAPELPFFPLPFFRERVGPGLLTLLQRYFRCCPGDCADEFTRRGLLLELIGELLRDPLPEQAPATASRAVFAAKERIDCTCVRPELTPGTVARSSGVTLNHLTRMFRHTLGVSVGEYLRNRRLEHACGLLQSTLLSVREIAFASGFGDANYFTRSFRRYFGETPLSWRGRAAAAAESGRMPDCADGVLAPASAKSHHH